MSFEIYLRDWTVAHVASAGIYNGISELEIDKMHSKAKQHGSATGDSHESCCALKEGTKPESDPLCSNP